MSAETRSTPALPEQMRVRFKKGNRVPYSQDFGFYRGVPDGVWFRVSRPVNQKWYTLTAPGYGIIDDYGNGSLFVWPDADSGRRHD